MNSMLLPTKVPVGRMTSPAALARMVRRDPHGDTVLAQINPQEAAMLRARGGAGVVNPRVSRLLGMPVKQFYINSNGPNGSMQGGVGSNSTPGSHAGSPGGPSNGGGNGGQGTGPRGPLGEGGLPIHTNATGPAGIATGQSDPSERGNGGVGSNYQGAVADYVDNYENDPVSRAVKFLTGIGLQQPNINQPATYANGLSHTGFNPVAQAVGIAGLFAPPGVGMVASKAAGAAYNALGGRNVIIGDASPKPGGTQTYDGTGGPSSSTAQSPGFGPGMGSANGSALPPISAPVPGAAVVAPPIAGASLPTMPALSPSTISVPGGFRPVWSRYGTMLPSYRYQR